MITENVQDLSSGIFLPFSCFVTGFDQFSLAMAEDS